MSASATKISDIHADLERATAFLADVLSQPHNDYMRAAAIQSFEICFELAWKYLQTQLRQEGLEANSPRSTFRQSGKAGFIDNVEAWLEFTEQRNLTVHTYHPQLADAIYATIKQKFLPAVQALVDTKLP